MKTVRHTFYYLLLRNFKNFAKDKKKIFFTFLSPLITIGFFGIVISAFVSKSYGDTLNGVAASLNLKELSESQIDTATNFFLISSIITVSSVTNAVTLAAVIVEDRAKNILTDFYISPTKSYLIRYSYAVINICLNIVLCWIMLIVGFVYMAAYGQITSELSLAFVKIFFTLMLSCMTSSLVFIFIFSFVKNTGVYTAVSSLLGIFVGVFVGAYFPLSILPRWLQQISFFIPATQVSSIFKNFLFEPFIDNIFGIDLIKIPIEARETLGTENLLFDHNVEKGYAIIYVISFTVLFLILNLIINPKIKSFNYR